MSGTEIYKIIWVNNMPTPYTEGLFSCIMSSSQFDLTIQYFHMSSMRYPWKKVHGNNMGGGHFKILLNAAKVLVGSFSNNSIFIIGGWHPRFYPLILLIIIFRGKFAIWADTPRCRREGRKSIKSRLRHYILSFIFKRASLVLGMGDRCLAEILKITPDREKVKNYPLWFSNPNKSQFDLLTEQSRFRMINVGRLDEIKRVDLVLTALRAVLDELPEAEIELIICGEGPCRQNLLDLTQKLKLQKYVNFRGWLEHEDVLKEMSQSSLYVHTAAWEPYGAVILEALSIGLPVLASDTTMAALDKVSNDYNGFIHTFGDIGQLSQQILLLYGDKEKFASHCNGAIRSSQDFTYERGSVELGKILQGLQQ